MCWDLSKVIFRNGCAFLMTAERRICSSAGNKVVSKEWRQIRKKSHLQTKEEGVALSCRGRFTHFESSPITVKLFPPHFPLFEPETFITCFAAMTDGWSTAHQDVWGLHTDVECSNRLL